MVMMNATPAMMMVMVDRPGIVEHDVSALVVDQLTTTQFVMQLTPPPKASWGLDEEPGVSGDSEGSGLYLELQKI